MLIITNKLIIKITYLVLINYLFLSIPKFFKGLMMIILVKTISSLLINDQDIFGKTSLMHAVINNDINNVKELIYNGADISIKDNNNRTALDYACINMHHHMINILK